MTQSLNSPDNVPNKTGKYVPQIHSIVWGQYTGVTQVSDEAPIVLSISLILKKVEETKG